jgi:hypothetical protein
MLAPYHPAAVHADANRFDSPADRQRRLHRFRFAADDETLGRSSCCPPGTLPGFARSQAVLAGSSNDRSHCCTVVRRATALATKDASAGTDPGRVFAHNASISSTAWPKTPSAVRVVSRAASGGSPRSGYSAGGRKLTSFSVAASNSSGVIRTTVSAVSPSLTLAASDRAAALWLSGSSPMTYTSASPNAK